MPLMKSKSKKAFSQNVESEMKAGKPQPQALAIAYSVKRKAKKASGGVVQSGSRDMNYADGGEVSISAKSEKRPMPANQYGDSDEMRRNKGNKRPGQDNWLDNPGVAAAKKPSHVALSEPRMVESSIIRTKMHKNEHDLMDSMPPSSPKDEPSEIMDEDGPDRQGPDNVDKSKPHKGPMAYAKGGEVNDPDHQAKRHNKAMDDEYGGMAEEDMVDDPAGLEEDDDQRRLPVDEYMSSNRMSHMLAEGGHIEEDMDNYADDGHEDSIAAAIMAKRGRLHAMIDSGAMDEDHAAEAQEDGIGKRDSLFDFAASRKPSKMADGGEVDLSINHDEEPNNEDQMSFEALKRENYNSSNLDVKQPKDSNLHGDRREMDEENEHDMISRIRSKMNVKRQFGR